VWATRGASGGDRGAEPDLEPAQPVAPLHATDLVEGRVLAVVARRALGQAAEEHAEVPRGRVLDRDALAVQLRDGELRRPRVRDGRADELVDAGLDREQEVSGRRGAREEGGIEARKRDRAREDAEVVDELVDLLVESLGRPRDQPEQALVGVGLAEQVDGLLGEELPCDVRPVGLGQVVPEAGEDDAVQCSDSRLASERRGPVAQRVFKTRQVV